MKWFALALFMLADVGAFYSVPKPVRAENEWALIPGCGFVLAAEYHFGAKLKAPNFEVSGLPRTGGNDDKES